MNEESKKEIKKGILTGAGTAAGAVIGAVVENTINATDVKVEDLVEAEVVDAVVENLDEVPEAGQSITEVESVSPDVKVDDPTPNIPHPERKPAQHNTVGSIISPIPKDELEPIVVDEAVVEVEAESEIIDVEESVNDEDIMVVSVSPEESDEEETDVYDVAISASDEELISEDNTLAPDYADMKDNDLNVGSSMMSTIEMPDYVNDANIDSFTDNV